MPLVCSSAFLSSGLKRFAYHRRYQNFTGSAPQVRGSRTLTAGSDSHRPRNTGTTVHNVDHNWQCWTLVFVIWRNLQDIRLDRPVPIPLLGTVLQPQLPAQCYNVGVVSGQSRTGSQHACRLTVAQGRSICQGPDTTEASTDGRPSRRVIADQKCQAIVITIFTVLPCDVRCCSVSQ